MITVALGCILLFLIAIIAFVVKRNKRDLEFETFQLYENQDPRPDQLYDMMKTAKRIGIQISSEALESARIKAETYLRLKRKYA